MDFMVLMDFNHEGHACRINTWQKKLAATSITVGTIIIIALIIWCAMVGVQKTEELLPGPWKYEAPSTPPSMTQENGNLEPLVGDLEGVEVTNNDQGCSCSVLLAGRNYSCRCQVINRSELEHHGARERENPNGSRVEMPAYDDVPWFEPEKEKGFNFGNLTIGYDIPRPGYGDE